MIDNTLTKEFYKQWLQDNQPIILEDALYYVQGVVPNSPDAKYYKKSTEWLHTKAILRAAEFNIGSLRNMLILNDLKASRWGSIKRQVSVFSLIDFTYHMYQFISLFPQELFEAYAEIVGHELFFTDYSPVRFFYATQARLDIWDVRKACYFISHADPDWRSWHLYSSYMPPMYTYRMIYPIIKMAKTSIKARQLKCVDGNPKLVRSIDMLQWAEKKDISPHPFLVEKVTECSSEG